ncbi:MAG: radical SAM protein [bacterium]|nr:radical SAM protein [bacterium]
MTTAAPQVETKVDHNYHQLPSDKFSAWESVMPPEYFEYREKWYNWPKEHRTGPVPIHLDIEATSNCNLKCTMCPRTDMVDAGTFWDVKNFDYDLYTRLIDEGVEKGLCSLKFNYLGEPLMHPRIVDMVKYAKDRGVVDVMFNTNATLLTERISRMLIGSGIDKLFFSFDSPYREHYNEIRINADYDKTLRNIKRFMALRDEMGSKKPFTRVSMVRMKENEHEWLDFKALFEPIVDAVAWVDYVDHTSQTVSGKQVFQIAPPRAAGSKKFCCPQLWQRMFVHPDGVVSVCCVDSARQLAVGNIKDRTLEEIWTGPEYTRMRELHATGRIDEIPVCASCPLSQLD